MKKIGVIILCLQFGIVFSQDKNLEKSSKEANQYTSIANNLLVTDGNFPKAEGEYRKAIAKNPVDAIPKYNLGNAYYGSEKYDEATQRYKEAAENATTKLEKHKAFHNQGNTYMEQKKYKEAVESYKNALRNNPKDNETRYNLALAKKMLEQQEKENEQNKDDKNQDKDQDKDQENEDKKEGDDKEDKKGDEGDKDQDKGEDQKDKGDEGEDKKDEKEEGKDKEEKDPKDDKKDKGSEGDDDKKDEKEGQPKDQKQVQGQLSPEQVKSLLEAMNNQEKKVQDKINAKKAQGSKIRTDKDW
ncbi:tetratricopeptide repeat protein [Aquimarina pacifica]|uniref:tetratricopeptide repeat protein n=1 Tax=Aquimarina pacifica TaxID=1296415 RepID=UPI00046FF114|nr:tetratricopeptide repeat protein [Aquimarina pacifica]